MILKEKTNVHRTNVNTPIAEFGMKKNAKAFKILSDNLYSDKILAIVRELSCNAWDSHKEAGKEDTPFVVTLPTQMNPEFSIQDFGVGMNDEDVRNVFTVYFESNKTQSNDLIGAYGLGSKSPFAYTTTFNVVAVKDGIKRNYTCFMDDKGIPSIISFGETVVTEENGVTISFPVENSNDQYSFSKATINALFAFPKKALPIVNGLDSYSGITSFEEGITESFGNWYLLENRRPRLAPHVRYGNIIYPIELEKVIPSESDQEYLRLLSENRTILLEVPLGKLDFAPSREELSYDAETKQYLKGRLLAVIQDSKDFLLSTVNNSSTYFEACRTYFSNLSSVFMVSHYMFNRMANSFPSWNGKEIKTVATVKPVGDAWRLINRGKSIRVLKNQEATDWNGEIKINLENKDTLFLFADSDRPKYTANLKRYLIKHRVEAYLFFDKDDLDELGNPEVVNISELEKVSSPRSNSVSTDTIKVSRIHNESCIAYDFIEEYSRNPSIDDIKSFLDDNENVILTYVVEKWNNPFRGQQSLKDINFSGLGSRVLEYSEIAGKLQGNKILQLYIRSSMENKVKDIGGKCFFEFMFEEIRDGYLMEDIEKLTQYFIGVNTPTRSDDILENMGTRGRFMASLFREVEAVDRIDELPADIRKIRDLIKLNTLQYFPKGEDLTQSEKAYSNILSSFRSHISTTDGWMTLEEKREIMGDIRKVMNASSELSFEENDIKAIYEKYPMLNLINGYYYGMEVDKINILLDYFQSIENCKA